MQLLRLLASETKSEATYHRLTTCLKVALWLCMLAGLVSVLPRPNAVSITAGISITIANLWMLFLLRNGNSQVPQVLTPFIVFAFLTYIIVMGRGFESLAIHALTIPIILGAMFGGRLLMLVITALSLGLTLLVYLVDIAPLSTRTIEIADLINLWLLLIVVSILLWLIKDDAENNRLHAESGALAVEKINQVLRRQNEALSAAEARYKFLAENANDIVMTCDRNFTVTYMSPLSEKYLGYTPVELVGENALNFVEPADALLLREHLLERLVQDSTDNPVEPLFVSITALHKRGATVPLEGRIAVLRDHSGSAVGYVGSLSDVSDRIILQAQQREVSQQLRQAQKMDSIGQMAGGVAHDFNNLLLAIQGYSDLLKQQESDQELTMFIEEIQKASDRAATLTRQLLTFSRDHEVTKESLAVGTLVLDLQNMLRPLIPENIELKCEVVPNCPEILGDKGQLEQLIVNLCLNARDAMTNGGESDGGEIVVALDSEQIPKTENRRKSDPEPGLYTRLKVRDNGCGMPVEISDRIFEPFFSTKAHGEGTGLGLTIVQSIVSDHNAYIDVESEPGSGTTFTVLFPASDSVASHPSQPGGNEKTAGTGQWILLVEDEDQVRKLVSLILTRSGYQVIEAIDGTTGIDAFLEHQDDISLVLSDVVMPEMGGQEMMETVRQTNSETPFIFMSGYSDNPEFIAAAGAGFVQKPFSATQLLTAVQEKLVNKPTA